MNYKISVIVRAYNSLTTIGRCLESIKSQVLSPIQIILVDDGSTDSLMEALSNYDIPNMIIVRLSQNLGAGEAIKAAKPYIEGEYVTILDSDDYYNQYTGLLTLYTIAKKDNLDLIKFGYFHCQYLYKSELFKECPHNSFRTHEDHYTWWCEKHAKKFKDISGTLQIITIDRNNNTSITHVYKENIPEIFLRQLYEKLFFIEEEVNKDTIALFEKINYDKLPNYLYDTYCYVEKYLYKFLKNEAKTLENEKDNC